MSRRQLPPKPVYSTANDPLVPDRNDSQQMALGHVQRRVQLFQALLYGSSILLASGAAMLVRLVAGVDLGGTVPMAIIGLIVLVICAVRAAILSRKPVEPSVAFVYVDGMIREDRRTPIVLAVLGVLFCAAALWLAPSGQMPRVLSILVGLMIMLGIGAYGISRARKLRLSRDEAHERRMSREGQYSRGNALGRRPVEPGPMKYVHELGAPTDFELRAIGYAGKRARTVFCFWLAVFVAGSFSPLYVGALLMGGDQQTWFIVELISLILGLVIVFIGLIRVRSDKPGKPLGRRSYGYSMRNSRGNRMAAISMIFLIIFLFSTVAIAAPPAREANVWPLQGLIAISLLAFLPFMLKAGEMLDRRHELYLDWMIRNGFVTAEYAKQNPPQFNEKL